MTEHDVNLGSSPFMTVIFGQLVTDINGYSTPGSTVTKAKFTNSVNKMWLVHPPLVGVSIGRSWVDIWDAIACTLYTCLSESF